MKKVFKFQYIQDYGGGYMYIAADSEDEAIDICRKQVPPYHYGEGRWDDLMPEQMKFTAGNTESGVLDLYTWAE